MLHRRKMGEKLWDLIEKNISDFNPGAKERYIEEVKVEDTYVVVRLRGAIDATTIPIVQERHNDHVARLDKHIIIDFKNVEHVDCSTIASLINLFAELKAHNKKLVIINETDQLIGYTEILRLKPAICIFSKEEEAIAYLSSV